jgi:hypothetical protein
MHLLPASGGATRLADRAISLLTSYENGSVKLWRYCKIEKERSIEGVGWECVWSFKLHVESGARTLYRFHTFFDNVVHLRPCYRGSHGNDSFTRPFYRPVCVCGSPRWTIRPARMCSPSHAAARLLGKS